MVCINCSLELSPGFTFCPRCGCRQPEPCAVCGFLCEADFALGGGGGSRGNASAETTRDGAEVPGDASQTVGAVDNKPGSGRCGRLSSRGGPSAGDSLFADLSGFTALSERLDAEEVTATSQNVLFEALSQSVKHYDGSVVKFVGDAVLAAFGAPVAHEDDPERALGSALDMLSRSAALTGEWRSRLGQAVTLHIAIHTGPIVAGNLADAAGAAFDVTGDTVNTAARLLGAAADGSVLVSGLPPMRWHVIALPSSQPVS